MKFKCTVLLFTLLAIILTGCVDDATSNEAKEHQHSWKAVDGVMTCSDCGEVNKDAEVKPLHGVPSADDETAFEKYINIFAQNNVQNEATFIESNGWIYGQAWDEDGQSLFIKVRTDGSDYTVLDRGMAWNIHIVDNYIYYVIDNGSTYGIYRMKTSGEDKMKVSDAYGSMQIVDRQIYYNSIRTYEYEETSDGHEKVLPQYCHLYRCELDGSDVTEIIAKPTFHFYVFEDGILYQDDNDKSSLHVCNLDGSKDTKLNDTYSYWPIYDGKYIYYVAESDPNNPTVRSIWKIKPDGTDEQQVANYPVSNGMLLSYDHIYFVYGDDSDRLYRIDKDGSNLTLITQDTNVAYPQLFEDLIKYTKYAEDYASIDANYFCDYDGSGKWDFLDITH